MPKKKQVSSSQEYIEIRGARQNNLQNIDVSIPINAFTVITGLSGSGKSSLAFDTLYAEGQRRYVESLSAYARQFLGVMNKPDVDSIRGLSPAIAIEQKKLSHNPRSTVGTVTEIYDYLRLLYARIGVPHCPQCNNHVRKQDAQTISKSLIKEYYGSRVYVLAPLVRSRKGTYDYLFDDLKRQGFQRVRADGVFYNLGSETIILKRNVKHDISVVIDRLAVSTDDTSRVHEAIENALKLGNGLATVLVERPEAKHNIGAEKFEEKLYSQHLACVDCGLNFDELAPRMFSFNAPQGACQECHGIGVIEEFDEALVIPDNKRSVMEGAVAPWSKVLPVRWEQIEQLAQYYDFDPWLPVYRLGEDVVNMILWGDVEQGRARSYGHYEGVIPHLKRLYRQTDSESRRMMMRKFMRETPCPSCSGQRLRPEVLAVRVGDKNIIEFTEFSIKEAFDFVDTLTLSATQKKIAEQVIKEIRARLSFLVNVGLDYLSLSRTTKTLSGGEWQRIHLATQIGTELRGVMYILDEPSIGLHQRDNTKLIDTLLGLRDLGNSVIVVEHDEDTMRAADFILDIGPGAGVHGGQVVAQGTAKEVQGNAKSPTGQYLSGKKKIAVPIRRRPARGNLVVKGAKGNNLKGVDISIPLSTLTCVTGVSGSGKSTFVNETLYKALGWHFGLTVDVPAEFDNIEGMQQVDKVITIDQSPIGRTPRSNPATYTGVFTYIRELFAETKEARMRGYQVGRFSFNVADGRCGNCQGDGMIKIEMHFLPDVYIPCEVCKGARYDDETLAVKYKEKTIADVLHMTVEEALTFFKPVPRIKNKLQTLMDVGLGYLELGQSSTTLSGGEAQRIKLASELSKRDTGRTLYLLDEPTTGLHFEDIQKLLVVLNRLVEKGNTVLVIEHNLDVIKTADHIIDLGPEGGDGGGELVAVGTPEEVAKVKGSYTGQFLKKMLS